MSSSPTTPESLAVRLREAREAVPYTQAELAEILNVSPRTLQTWEAGREPQPRHYRRLMTWLTEAEDGQAA